MTGAQLRRRYRSNPHGPRRCGHNPARIASPVWACRPKKVPLLLDALNRLGARALRQRDDWFRELLRRRTYVNDGRTKDAIPVRPTPTVEETRSQRIEAHCLLLQVLISRCVLETLEVGIWRHGAPDPISLRELDQGTGLNSSRVDRALQDLAEGGLIVRVPQEQPKQPDGSYKGRESLTYLTPQLFLALGFTEDEIKKARADAANRSNYRRPVTTTAPAERERTRAELRSMVHRAGDRARADYDPAGTIGATVPERDRAAYNVKLLELRRERPDDDPDRLRREAADWLAQMRPPPRP
jgi:hypothetical protein